MERLDNPAGRLHAALTAFNEHASESVSVQDAWSQALEVEGDDLWAALGAVAASLARIEQALLASENEDQVAAFRHWQPSWARPIFPPDRAFNTGSQGLVEPGALHALWGMSSLLSRTASEGFMPDGEVVQSLRVKLVEAVDAVLTDDDLPADLRQILLHRLHEMIWALDHARVVGPDGVQAAAERLMANLVMGKDEHRRGPTVKVVLGAVGAAWAAFHSLPLIRNSITAGQELLKMIGS